MRYVNGIKLALLTAGFSGIAVFLNGLTVKAVGDALVFTTIKNLGTAALLTPILLRQKINWPALKAEWKPLLALALIGGSLPFYLFFKGLTLTNPAMGALIHKTLIFWVALWAIPVLKEKISVKQWLALAIIFGSNFIIGGLPRPAWGAGEAMILAATMLWSVETVVAKNILKRVQVDVVVGARMILGSLILLSVVSVSGKLNLIFKLSGSQWLMTAVSVLMLTGYVMSWYRALQKIPVTLAASVLTLAMIITNILSSIFITHKLSEEVIYQSVFMVIGTWYFAREVRQSGRFAALG